MSLSGFGIVNGTQAITRHGRQWENRGRQSQANRSAHRRQKRVLITDKFCYI
jgi:hypothetical protein